MLDDITTIQNNYQMKNYFFINLLPSGKIKAQNALRNQLILLTIELNKFLR
jgi:hypothetical protein